MLAPGTAVLVGFVLLVGNPWLNLEATAAPVPIGSSSTFRLLSALVSYPAWYVDADRVGPFWLWFSNLRVLLFVLLAGTGLSRVRRWAGEAGGAIGLFITTVGLTTLTAVIAGLGSGLVVVALFDEDASLPFVIPGATEEFFLAQLSMAAVFGVLIGSLLGAVVAAQRWKPAHRERPARAPKSLW